MSRGDVRRNGDRHGKVDGYGTYQGELGTLYQRPRIKETMHQTCHAGNPLSQLLGGAAVSSHCRQLGVDCSST